jgi:hypothetical protein
VRRDEWKVSARTYWALRRWSPVINLIGMAAGGLLLVRAILVFGVAGDEYRFGLDIPFAAAVLLGWVAVVLVTVRAPSQAVATPTRPAADQRVIVPAFDMHSPLSFLVVVPIAGLLGALMWAFLFSFLVEPWSAPSTAQLLWRAAAIGGALLLILPIRAVARATRHGVELTRTDLVAFGYVRTQKFARTSIVDVEVVDAALWASFVFFLLRIDGRDSRVLVRLAGGGARAVAGTHAPAASAERGAQLLRAWAGTEGD